MHFGICFGNNYYDFLEWPDVLLAASGAPIVKSSPGSPSKCHAHGIVHNTPSLLQLQ